MRRILCAAVVLLAFMVSGAHAGERAVDAALGAASGAIVLGPIGAAAGAVIGYTAGPAIARSWGLRGNRRGYRKRRVRSAPRARTASRSKARATSAPSARKTTKGKTKRGNWYNVIRP